MSLAPLFHFTKALRYTWILPLLLGCDRAPPEPLELPRAESPEAPEEEPPPADQEPAVAACIAPLASPPPPPAKSVESCPLDPEGRPAMPTSEVVFVDAPDAPQLEVELALTDEHRQHGLMFRPSLSDEEGMLFSWQDEAPRSFWMRNTCLALDMLFLAKDGTIVGILEQVPPMNVLPRRVPCKAAHVLEVRAGWTRHYGVKPGQKVSLKP